MFSCFLARVKTSRLRDWSDQYGALDYNQDGFGQKKSTVDTTQTMKRLNKDNRRVNGIQGDPGGWTRVLDLRKSYLRVSCSLLWKTIEIYGVGSNVLVRPKDFHEVTA